MKKKVFKKIGFKIAITVITIFFIVGGITIPIYGVTSAIGAFFSSFFSDDDGYDITEKLDQMSAEELQSFADENGAFINGDKLKKYIKKERESVPSSINGSKITIKDGRETSETVSLDTSSFVNKYKLSWEFLAAVDLASFQSIEGENTNILDNSNIIKPVFDWNSSYTKDTYSYSRTWHVTTEYDPTTGKTTEVKNEFNTYNMKNSETVVKMPLAIPNKITTMFGETSYKVRKDVVVLNEDWCKPTVISEKTSTKQVFDKKVDDTSKPKYKNEEVYVFQGANNSKSYNASISVNKNIVRDSDLDYKYKGAEGDYYKYEATEGFWIFKRTYTLLLHKSDIPENESNQTMHFKENGIKKIFNGYEKKDVYKTITIKEKLMSQSKKKIIEDKVADITETFNPAPFIKFLNAVELSVDDLPLVRECLLNIPKTSSYVETIDRIINGDYGDITIGGGNTGGGSGLPGYSDITDGGGIIPLFLQRDERWKDAPFGTSNVGDGGCGPTSLAMIVAGLGGNISGISQYDYNKNGILEPNEMAAYGSKYYVDNVGVSHAMFSKVATDTGLSCRQTYSTSEVLTALKDGKIVLASMGPGIFTRGGHMLVLTGISGNGELTMNDPASKTNSQKTWNPNTVFNEAKGYWIYDNPNLIVEKFVATSYYAFTYADAAEIGTPEAMDEAKLQGGNDSTATGLYVGDKDLRHKILAVDPKLIPYKTRVYVSFPQEVKTMTMPDGHVVSLDGYYLASDCGGAIKEKRIDVYMGAWKKSHQYKDLAYQFGRRNVTIRRSK